MTIIKISEVLIFLIFAEKAFMNAVKISKIKYHLIPKSRVVFGVSVGYNTKIKTKLNPQTDLESRYGSIEGKISEGVIYTNQSFFSC